MGESTDEKLDRIIELLQAIHSTLENMEGGDYTYQVYSEIGSLRSSVDDLYRLIQDYVPGES